MSLEKHLRDSVLKIALLHIAKSKSHSPERICRNILEMISVPMDEKELLTAIKNMPSEQLVNWLLARIP